ncbi:MAG: hypothetical protein EOO50_10730 [Flavobacterium sp.]|uniref:hypothetical protein n=1 Tax=Flavobacterium sp. TaxID=239 RepID=UPI0012278437|nr:hypothetical protein [Flavobacterium sp.]RZJ66133.1 MAG: hypothetical protein EOO50_10730 [Flavobacterium sp.]
MKKSIITLALALVAAIGTNANNQYGFSEIDSETALFAGNGDSITGQTRYFANEENVLNPEVYFKSGYVKSHEDVVKCDSEVVEGNARQEIRPLIIERTSVDLIDESNRVIDGVLPEIAPLNFAYINGSKKQLPLPVCQPQL